MRTRHDFHDDYDPPHRRPWFSPRRRPTRHQSPRRLRASTLIIPAALIAVLLAAGTQATSGQPANGAGQPAATGAASAVSPAPATADSFTPTEGDTTRLVTGQAEATSCTPGGQP